MFFHGSCQDKVHGTLQVIDLCISILVCHDLFSLHNLDCVHLLTKKKVFDKVMLIQRLEEEQVILVQEAKQHWLSIQSQQHKMSSLLDTVDAGGKNIKFYYYLF